MRKVLWPVYYKTQQLFKRKFVKSYTADRIAECERCWTTTTVRPLFGCELCEYHIECYTCNPKRKNKNNG